MSDSSIAPGTILAGRYQVRRELGRGGMGIVYLCRDLVVDERVAMKLLMRPGAKNRPEDAWWFHEEARALAGLNHPAIVRARDFGTLSEGTPYLVMDAVPGRSLHEWIYLAHTDGLVPWPIVWFTVDQVLGALAHSHARGVVHGDLKPSNILLDMPKPGEGGELGDPTVHVLDLGLAWLFQDRVDHRLDGSKVAEPTVRWGAGTPGWMAPEQIRLAAPHVGPGTDLYALGCILFALLSDREPYTGSNEELLQQHRNAPVPSPDIPTGVPREVAPFCVRLMAKRPWHRFDFAGDARRQWRLFKPGKSAGVTPVPRAAGSPRIAPSREEITMPDAVEVEFEPPTTTTGLLGLRPAPLVARNAERARLLNLAADVMEAPGRHRFVLLSGDAGVGKSRLAEWLCEEVHERALLIPLRARYRKISAPLDGVVGSVIQHYRLERAERDVIEKVLMNVWGVDTADEEGATWVAAAAEWLKPGAAGAKVGPSGKRFTLDRPELRWLVIRRTLERIGKDRPILLWLDDLHHASATTFEGLTRIHQGAKGLNLLVVATARGESVEADPMAGERLERALVEWDGERMDIAPLDASHTHALLRETLPLDDAAVSEAAARSKGNPLFALQILHAWSQGGHMELKDGRYVVPAASLEARAATTAELWEERVAALPEDVRPAALAASALGGDIRRDVLGWQLEALGLDAERAVGAMKRAQILLASGADRVRWPHALLQEHLLAQLFALPDAATVFRAAADALARHPESESRRIVRHRVVNLVRAGDLAQGAELLHQMVAQVWSSSRDVSAVLRDLAMLDGKLEGRALARHYRWRAEALRHAGKLEDSRREAESARAMFHAAADIPNEAHCLRLLGHVASDLAAPAHGRRLVARALSLFEEIGDEHGRAQCEVVLGEIDYLLGDHARARNLLAASSLRFLRLGDRLGRAQCLLLLSFVEQAGGSPARAREMTREARREFDGIGYRLGIAQCDISAAHSDHREGKIEESRTTARGALTAFRDLGIPRGEAAAERLLAMAALDAGEPAVAETHAETARAFYDNLADPWGQVEAGLIMAQAALDRGDADSARGQLIACEAHALAEAEPKQHRHLTLAWLAYHEGRFHDALRELDAARAAFKDSCRTGDHTPQLLERFARMGWPKQCATRITNWRRAITAAETGKPVIEIIDEETIPLPRA